MNYQAHLDGRSGEVGYGQFGDLSELMDDISMWRRRRKQEGQGQ